jgi:hypothetical protein
MPFRAAPYDEQTIRLMTAALDTAWTAAGLAIPDLSHTDRGSMELAILNATAAGERDFKNLQKRALEALGARAVERDVHPIERRVMERRRQIRLVGSSDGS